MKFFSKKSIQTPPKQAGSLDFTEENTQALETIVPETADEAVPQPKGNVFQRLFPKKGPDGQKKKLSKKAKIILVCVVLVAAIVALKLLPIGKKADAASVTYTAATVQKRDVTVTLTGTATLAAANAYDVSSLVTGEVKSANFEKGDTVQEGDVLYQIDTSDAETGIESAALNVQKSELSYENAQKALANLTVSSPASGTITELNVKVGDNVQSGGKIGVVRNSGTMSLKVPFNSADAASIRVGQSATVTLDSTFETLSGTVTKVAATEQVLTGNMLVRYVTIDVTNPGGITDTTTGSAQIGDVACNSSATFAYKSSETISAKASGTVTSLSAEEGDRVSSGQTVLTLSSSDAEQNVTNAKLSLEEARNNLKDKQKALENYTIKSPISGTVIEKTVKAGDKLTSGGSSSTTTLCKIYDLSYLTMDMSVDELDVNKVKVGQKVTITADAAEGKTYEGEVTSVSISGTTSNGVTAYPVTIKLTETEGLLPGMNVNAKIVVESVSNVLTVPVDAVVRGNTVLAQSEPSTAVKDGDKLTLNDSGKPTGFKSTKVTLGVSNDNYIEIKSGLKQGDVVAVATVVADSSKQAAGQFGMEGGRAAQGGEMPQGSGGEPQGGGRASQGSGSSGSWGG